MDIVVSNRVAAIGSKLAMTGGLAAALLPAVKKSGVVWFGSSGRTRDIPSGATPLVQIQSYGHGTIATVDVPERHYARFYEGYANSALWPLLHSRVDLSKASTEDYASYLEINAYMARMLATFGGVQSCIWVHDYHFLPLAAELRQLGVAREIGFFLHTPWPAPQVFASLAQARELADAMLAYDLIGFQTELDRINFADFVTKELRMPSSGKTIRSRHGICRLATFPIGIDVQEFAEQAQRAVANGDVQRLHTSLNGARLLIGVDRIDYSKGLRERLRAFDRLLERYPRLRRRLALLQIAIPSRSGIETYLNLQHEVAALAGEVNARHGEVDWTPVRYITKSFRQSTLAGFYRASAVAVVTPLRDGMNLVAKEYVAAQDPSDPGVLVLSRTAGAARELHAALQVDPNDIETTAHRIASAFMMPLEERRARWQDMMDVLLRHSLYTWFSDFMTALKATHRDEPRPVLVPHAAVPQPESELAAAHR